MIDPLLPLHRRRPSRQGRPPADWRPDRSGPPLRAAADASSPTTKLAEKNVRVQAAKPLTPPDRKPHAAKSVLRGVAIRFGLAVAGLACLGALAVMVTRSHPSLAPALRATPAEAEAATPASAALANPVSAAPAAAAPTSADAPQRTTASYADWVVQCQKSGSSPPRSSCAMMQTTQVRGKNVAFSRVIVLEAAKGQPYKFIADLPPDVSFAKEVEVQSKDAATLFSAPFERCMPAGCFADIDLGAAALQKLRAATGSGKLVFADAMGRDITVPLSFNGFAQALDAMAEE
jgi:invasion protein IalB